MAPASQTRRRDRIFERFTRLDEARTAAAGGTGLGLAISREIVERHQGSLTLLPADGGGARFELQDPLGPLIPFRLGSGCGQQHDPSRREGVLMLKKWLLGMAVALLAAACNASTAECPTEGEVLETAKLYIEHNATDADTGVHGLFGGEAWSELCIWAPDGELIMVVDPQGPLGDLTVSDLFFESREPPSDEFSMEDFQAAFPEGEYTVEGTDFEGMPRVGTALFTHDVPAEPNITAPVLAEDEESAGESVVSPVGLVVTWDPVTELTAGDSLNRHRLRGDHHQGRP